MSPLSSLADLGRPSPYLILIQRGLCFLLQRSSASWRWGSLSPPSPNMGENHIGLVDEPIASPNVYVAPRLTRPSSPILWQVSRTSGVQRGYFWPSNTQVNVIFIINCMLIVQSSNLFSPLTLFVDDNVRRQRTTMMNDDGNNDDEQRQ